MQFALRRQASTSRSQTCLEVAISLLAFNGLVSAVSLSDFTPRPQNTLSSVCKAIYDAPITGCQPVDFTSGGECSTTCVDALNALQGPVAQACPSMTGDNLLVAAINGLASVKLCKNGKSASPLPQSSLSPPTSAAAPASPAASSQSNPTTSSAGPLIDDKTTSSPSGGVITSTITSAVSSTIISGSSTLIKAALSTSCTTMTLSSAPDQEGAQSTSAAGPPSKSDLMQSSSTVTSVFHQQTAGTPFDIGSTSVGPVKVTLSSLAWTTTMAFLALLLPAWL